MFLRNFDNFMMSLMGVNAANLNNDTADWLGNTHTSMAPSDSAFDDTAITIKTTKGVGVKNTFPVCNDSSYGLAPIRCGIQGIVFGDGNAAVTYEDYKLSGNQVTLSVGAQTVTSPSFNSSNKKWERVVTVVLNNLSSSNQIIKEWGIWMPYTNDTNLGRKLIYPGTQSFSSSFIGCYNNSNDYTVLLFREVFENPITIQANGSATVTLTIGFPMPNHP